MSDEMAERTRAMDPPAGSRLTLGLWAGVLLGPLAWVFHLLTSYALATLACPATAASLLITAASAVAVAVAGGVVAWRSGTGLGPAAETDQSRLGRRQFMSASGVALSVLFTFVIVVESIPVFFLRACQ